MRRDRGVAEPRAPDLNTYNDNNRDLMQSAMSENSQPQIENSAMAINTENMVGGANF